MTTVSEKGKERRAAVIAMSAKLQALDDPADQKAALASLAQLFGFRISPADAE